MARKAANLVLHFPPERLRVLRGFHDAISLAEENPIEQKRREDLYRREFCFALWQARKSLPAMEALKGLPMPDDRAERSLLSQYARLEKRIRARAERFNNLFAEGYA